MATANFKSVNTVIRCQTVRPGFTGFGRSWRKRKATSHHDHHSPVSVRYYRCGRNPVLPRWRRAASRVARRVQKSSSRIESKRPSAAASSAIARFTSPISDRSAICCPAQALFGLLNEVFAYLGNAQQKPVSMHNSFYHPSLVSAVLLWCMGALIHLENDDS